MNNLNIELSLAEQLQAHVANSDRPHHLKITDRSIILNFRNPPREEIIELIKKWGFEPVPGHIDRKYIRQRSLLTRVQEKEK